MGLVSSYDIIGVRKIMQVSVCDYCLKEGKVTETLTKIVVSKSVTIAGCKKHEKNMVKAVSSERTSKEFQDMIEMVSKNLKKRGKVLAVLKKKG